MNDEDYNISAHNLSSQQRVWLTLPNRQKLKRKEPRYASMCTQMVESVGSSPAACKQ